MSLATQRAPWSFLGEELHRLRHNWFWLMLLGIGLVIVGMAAIAASCVATLTTVVVLGTLFLIGGGVQVVNAFFSGRWRGFWLHLLEGIIYLALGFVMIGHPLAAAAGFTLMLAAAFLAGGLFRIITALVDHFHGWGWVLLNGVVTFILGLMIWRDWPASALWVIGLFVGIDMIFAGWAWIMTGLAVHSIPENV